jgi:hypothetical protein
MIVTVIASSVRAFAPIALFPHKASRRDVPTALNLHPEQGSQLQAAWNAAVVKAKQSLDEASTAGSMPVVTKGFTIDATSAARAFVSRVFSIPSVLIGRHPHPSMEGFDDYFPTYSHEKGAILYPVVGFHFVPDSEKHCRVLAKATAPHCRIHDMRNEGLIGWWSAGCYLDIFDEDIAHAPRYTDE